MTDEQNTDTNPLLAAMAHVGRVEKDKRNKHGNYDYMSEQAVKVACQKAFVACGVMPSGITTEVLKDDWLPIGKGQQNVVKVRVSLHFRRADSDIVDTYQGLGAGVDYGDKATMKGQTSAIREALKSLLCIPSGSDPEEDVAPPPQPEPERQRPSARAERPAATPAQQSAGEGPRTMGQRALILELVDKSSISRPEAGNRCKAKYQVAPDQLTEAQANSFIKDLEGLT